MHIAAFTDIHGAYSKVFRIIESESPDIVIIGGDLTTVGTVKEAEEAIGKFLKLTGKLFCVAGNMDLPYHDDLFVRLGVSINGRGIVFNDVGFFGVSAAPLSPLHTPYELSEDEIAGRIRNGYEHVRSSKTKIFVPHAPPYGTKVDIVHSGIHVGSTAVREFIEDTQPDVVICGHIHEGRGEDSLGISRIINCGSASQGHYCVVDLSPALRITAKRG